MSRAEQVPDLNMQEVADPRAAWIAERDAKVMEAARVLLAPLIEENPFIRLSLGSVLHRVAEETDIARALVHGSLKSATERRVPIDEHKTVLNIACDRGSFYIHATRPFEDIQSLPPKEQSTDLTSKS